MLVRVHEAADVAVALAGRRRADDGRPAAALGRREALLLFLGQLLVGLPRALTRLRGQVLRGLVVLARDAALLGRHPDPFGHALLQALLRIGRHLRVARRDLQPFALAGVAERVPLVGERRERDVLRGRQARPRQRAGGSGQRGEVGGQRDGGRRERRRVGCDGDRLGLRVETRVRGDVGDGDRDHASEKYGQAALLTHPCDPLVACLISGRAKDTR
ncbi:hypothetical protein BUB20358_05355 [Burkholderia ubonensis]|nr:hypothetical protein BUB20358_05355 [Burkholderia ubonensis]